jgi:hypothetical protein
MLSQGCRSETVFETSTDGGKLMYERTNDLAAARALYTGPWAGLLRMLISLATHDRPARSKSSSNSCS